MDLFSVLLVLDNTICIKHIIITFIITLIIIIITIIIIMIIMIMIMIIIIIIIIIITIFIIIVTISFIIITEFITTHRFYVYPSWLQHLMPRPTVLYLSPHTHTHHHHQQGIGITNHSLDRWVETCNFKLGSYLSKLGCEMIPSRSAFYPKNLNKVVGNCCDL